jgi:hypothetical protein
MLRRAALPVAVILALAARAPGEGIDVAATREYPNAGISLAMPEGFTFVQPADANEVLGAELAEGGQASMSVRLSAFASAPDTAPEVFLGERYARFKDDSSITQLETVSESCMPVASSRAAARMVSYLRRDEPMRAAWVCFARDLPQGCRKLVYVLSVECRDRVGDRLLPTLGQIVGTVSLVSVRSPSAVSPGPKGPAVVDEEWRWRFSPPVRWFASSRGRAVAFAQTDYLRPELTVEGLPVPQLRVTAVEVPSGTSPQACVAAGRDKLPRADGAADGVKACLSEGPARLAGLDAYQLTVLKTALPASTSRPAETGPASAPAGEAGAPATAPTSARAGENGGSIVVSQRTACVAGEDGKTTAYSLVLICRTGEANEAVAMLDELAEGFALCPSVRTQPADPPPTNLAGPK